MSGNTFDAINVIKHQKPEIIITDIRMSGINGFEMIEKIEKYDFEIILISSFTEFEYAKKAINLKVADYILKPVEETELYKILKSTKYIIEQKQCQSIITELSNNTQQFMGFISAGDKIDGIIKSLRDYSFDLNGFEMFVEFKINNIDLSDFIVKIHDEIITRTYCKYFIGMLGYNRIFCIFNNSNKEELQRLQEIIQISNSCTGISEIFINIRDVKKYYIQADVMAESNFITGKNKVYLYKKEPNEIRIIDELNTKISQFTSIDMLLINFTYIVSEINKICNIENICTIYNLIIEHAYKLANQDYEFEKVNYKNIADKAPEIKVLLNDLFEIVKLLKQNKKVITNNQSLVGILEHININIDKKIQLYSIADKFHINPNYLSQLFKKELNISFTDFVINLKMKRASELLLKTDMTLYEISEMVGYDDYIYFCKTFKKIIQQSPNVYRKSGNRLTNNNTI